MGYLQNIDYKRVSRSLRTQSPVCPVKPALCSVSSIEVGVELMGQAIVVDWCGVSMVWGLTGF